MNNNANLENNIIMLQNQVKILKEENQNLLKNAISKELLDTLYPKNLRFKNINFNEKGAFLVNENSVQFGPYKKYEEGKYCIIYYGNNLTKASFDCCDNKGNKLLKISMLYQLSDKAAYEVFLPKNNECIEFRARGKNKRTLIKEFRKLNKKEKEKNPLTKFKQVNSLIEKVEVYRYNNY